MLINEHAVEDNHANGSQKPNKQKTRKRKKLYPFHPSMPASFSRFEILVDLFCVAFQFCVQFRNFVFSNTVECVY